MAISNLTGQKTYQSFRNLMQISSSGQVYDGLGNLVTSLQLTASFASGSSNSGGTGAGFPFSGSAVITGSLLVSSSLTVTGSLRVNGSITGSLFGTSSWAANSISSSYPLTVTGSTLRSTYVVGGTGASTTASIFIGSNAGLSATNANNSNFLGQGAGQNATNANNSNFFGFATGYQTNANNSNFFGSAAGYQATNASNSNFLGQGAGQGAISASNSTLLGVYAGADLNGNSSIGSNNIIIGTRITLASQRKDSINLGGIIFATGSYSGGIMYSGSQAGIGRVGINVVNPTYTLQVGGTVAFPNITNAGYSDVLYRNPSNGEITYAAAPSAATSATINQINTPAGENVFIRPVELEQSKYATHNIYNNLNFT